MKIKKYLTFYNIFLSGILVLNLLAIGAPVLLELGLETLAKYIYILFSFFCHQIHYRSLHLFDYQFAWCARDTFIWLGLFFTGVFLKFVKVREIKLYEVAFFVLPMALDGGIQLLATLIGFSDVDNVFYSSTNLTRMITGSLLGIGIGLWIFTSIESVDPHQARHQKRFKLKFWSAVGTLLLFLFGLYITFVGLWEVTSDDYKPDNMLDSTVKLPEDKDDWFIRRENAVCTVNSTEQSFLNFNCEE